MTVPDTSKWSEIGRSDNTRYFVIERGLLIGVPDDGSVDTEQTAIQNVDFQNQYFRDNDGGIVIVVIDPMTSQDKGARTIYQSRPDPSIFWGTALVGGSMLSRAIGSFFLGLAKPKTPFKMFSKLEEALPWARDLLQSNRQKSP